MSTVIPLASRTLNAAGDAITVELHRPPDTPPFVRVVWPTNATVHTPPARFPAIALAAIALLDEAMIGLYAAEADL